MSTAPAKPAPTAEHFWLGVLCVLGLDYFSTLAYQPSITFAVAGRLGPLATVVVVLATLLGACRLLLPRRPLARGQGARSVCWSVSCAAGGAKRLS